MVHPAMYVPASSLIIISHNVPKSRSGELAHACEGGDENKWLTRFPKQVASAETEAVALPVK